MLEEWMSPLTTSSRSISQLQTTISSPNVQKPALAHYLFEGGALRYYNSNVQGKAKSITDVCWLC
jgi:hypothetical protein